MHTPQDLLALTPVQQDALVEAAVDGSTSKAPHRAVLRGRSADTEHVRRAWERVAARHPLSIRLVWEPDGTVHQVRAAAVPPIVTTGEDAVPTQAASAEDRPLVALEVGDTHRALIYTRCVLDDRSAELLLGALETELAGEKAPALPGLEDYLAWEGQGTMQESEQIWREWFSEVDGPKHLLSEGSGTVSEPAVARVTVPAATLDGLHSVARSENADVSWLLHAAWSKVVSIYRGESVVVVGTLVDTRPDGLRDAIGSHESVLPSVSPVSDAITSHWLTEHVHRLRSLHRHSRVTGARINDWAGTERGVRLYDSVVDLRAPFEHTVTTGPLPAPLVLSLRDDGLVLEHDRALVSEDEAHRLLRHTLRALEHLTDDRCRRLPLSEASLFDEEDHATTTRVNDTSVETPDMCLHQIFEETARLTPDAPALTYGHRTLSYRQLNERANRLAHHLVARGVRPDDIVGLCAEPGLGLATALLAILKAGGAYAPLDPTFPPERLSYLAEDLRCTMTVVEGELRPLLPDLPGDVVDLSAPEAWEDQPATDPHTGVVPSNLAYVMYTSGSTGRPKGVLIEHGGSVNFISWMSRAFPLAPEESVLQWTAYSFDAAVWEFFLAFFVGARTVMAPARLHLELDSFVALIERERVATLHFVPAMLHMFLTADGLERCRSLRYVFASGEPIPTSLADRFHESLDTELVNLYGVTEVSIDSTFYRVPRGVDLPFIRSGRPLDNTSVYVLNTHMRPVPVGARGEVFLGGASVTRGYLGRPDLTADRFLPDPFTGEGARMYRTGDMATLLPDGQLHFHGRSDHQVKIRGIRIETLEVEAEIETHPAVRDSLVTVWGEDSDRGLVAYIVPDGELDSAEMRSFLGSRVPPYMVPSVIEILPAFPLTVTGKVDRKALPDPSAARRHVNPTWEPPRTETERRIALIWCHWLDLRELGVHEDFFALGGNSLLAARVIADVRRAFDVELPLRAWLESSCVADLARMIDRNVEGGRAADRILEEIESLPSGEPQ